MPGPRWDTGKDKVWYQMLGTFVLLIFIEYLQCVKYCAKASEVRIHGSLILLIFTKCYFMSVTWYALEMER